MTNPASHLASLKQLWPQILKQVKQRRRVTWMLLTNVTIVSYDGSTLVLSVDSEHLRTVLSTSDLGKPLREVLRELLSGATAIEMIITGGGDVVRIPISDEPVQSGALTATAPPASRTPGVWPVARTAAPLLTPQTFGAWPVAPTPAPTPVIPSVEGGGAGEDLWQAVAQTAFLLQERGDSQAAALLLDVEGVELKPGNRFGDWHDAVLIVPSYLASRFTEAMIAVISPVLTHVAERHEVEVRGVQVAPALQEVRHNWRQELEERLASGGASNQAARSRAQGADNTVRCDEFSFDSKEEVRVYEALKRAQATLPSDSTISIFPLPLGRVGIGKAWTPDFLVVVAGRAGLIEVDGPHHRGRYAADSTRDRHWRNSGIVHIDRFLVEETSDGADLDKLVAGFLKRLREHG